MPHAAWNTMFHELARFLRIPRMPRVLEHLMFAETVFRVSEQCLTLATHSVFQKRSFCVPEYCVSRETAFAECRLPRVSRETSLFQDTQDSCQSLEHARLVPIRQVFHVKQHSSIMPEPLPNTPFRRNANIFWGPTPATEGI
jgi:hypothetical protein